MNFLIFCFSGRSVHGFWCQMPVYTLLKEQCERNVFKNIYEAFRFVGPDNLNGGGIFMLPSGVDFSCRAISLSMTDCYLDLFE